MDNHGLNPAGTAMAVLIQPLVAARASGGGLSETAEGHMLLSATWGLGSAIAQGEVVPDRIVLSRQGFVRSIAGRPQGSSRHLRPRRQRGAAGGAERACARAVPRRPARRSTLGRLLRKCEDLMGMPVEIEWALDDDGFKLLQARPLHVQATHGAGRDLAARIPSSTAIPPASAGAPAAPWW